MRAFKRPLWKMLLFYLLGVLSAGLLFLVSLWSVHVRSYLQLTSCSFEQADVVRVLVRAGGEGGMW